MKSSSCTGTRLNWRRNSKKQDDSVEGLVSCYVYRTSQLLLSLSRIEAMSSAFWSAESEALRSAEELWSAENEALPQSKALWSAESEAKSHGKISNFPTFLLYIDYELLLRSLRSLRSKNVFCLQVHFHANQTQFQRFCTKTRFGTEALDNSEMAYFWRLQSLLKFPQFLSVHLNQVLPGKIKKNNSMTRSRRI